MASSQIGKKAGLEHFLITGVFDFSRNPKDIQKFLYNLTSTKDTLDKLFIDGHSKVLFVYDQTSSMYSSVSDALIASDFYGGLEISSPTNKSFGMHVHSLDKPQEKSPFPPIEVSLQKPYEKDRPSHIEISLHNPQKIWGEIEINPNGKIYAVKSVNQSSAILLRDYHFWQEVGQSTGLTLNEIEPQYTCKRPVTPWYKSIDSESEAVLTMGRRWRVDSIEIDFKHPVPARELENLFGKIDVTRSVDNQNWNGTKIKNKEKVSSFLIHSWSKDATIRYTQQLLDLARSYNKK